MAGESKKTRQDELRLPKSWKESFADDVRYLWCPTNVNILQEPPSPLSFHRDYVSTSRPCIIRNAIVDPITCNPLHLTLNDIMERLDADTTLLTVDVTPDGHGDCVRKVFPEPLESNTTTLMFVQPKEVRMSLREFHHRLQRQEGQQQQKEQEKGQHENNMRIIDSNHRPVVPLFVEDASRIFAENDNPPVIPPLPEESIVYYSRQNDCLRTPEDSHPNSVTDLATLFPSGFDWVPFDTPLEAVNLWMGNACSVSSMHKDHYENLFYVASGEKIFTVCPPADAPFLYQQIQYPSGQFECDVGDDRTEGSSQWKVRPFSPSCMEASLLSSSSSSSSSPQVRWIYPDLSFLLSDPDDHTDLLHQFPLLQHAHPMEIRVQAGEMLYLPSLWFHRVTQSCETIGVNYWYEMRFDGNPLWCYFQLLQELELGRNNRSTEDKDDKNDNEEDSIR